MTPATTMTASEAIEAVRAAVTGYEFEMIISVPTQLQRDALAALPNDDIAPDDVCDVMDMEHGSTWGEVRDGILQDAKLGLRWYEARVSVTKVVRVPAESDKDANEKLDQWAFQGWSPAMAPELLEEIDEEIDVEAELSDY